MYLHYGKTGAWKNGLFSVSGRNAPDFLTLHKHYTLSTFRFSLFRRISWLLLNGLDSFRWTSGHFVKVSDKNGKENRSKTSFLGSTQVNNLLARKQYLLWILRSPKTAFINKFIILKNFSLMGIYHSWKSNFNSMINNLTCHYEYI